MRPTNKANMPVVLFSLIALYRYQIVQS